MAFAVEREVGGKTLRIETGDIARQAHGAALVRFGDTVVLVTAVTSESRPDIDFFPLFLQYREKLSAVGKIPGGRFMKREGRPTTKEVLTMRLMDRPLRPLFPPTYKNEVQISSVVLSADNDCCDPDVLAMVGASAALCISPIPFNGPVGTVRLGRLNGEYLVNPTNPQVEACDFVLIVSGTRDRVVMLEGEANEVPEDEIAEAILFAQKALQPIIEMQEELVANIGVSKDMAPEDRFDYDLYRLVKNKAEERVRNKITMPTKQMRNNALKDIRDSLIEEMCGEDEKNPADPKQVKACFERLIGEIVRSSVVSGQRIDGRSLDDLRTIECQVGVLPRTHGSALFRRGETQALVTATLGTSMDEELVVTLQDEYSRKFMLQYSHPSWAVGETGPDRGPSRRDIGHGALAEKALAKVLPDDFPYTLRLVSDILESNGSTSQASVCGATLCLMDAGVQIRRPVAGISVGLVEHEGNAHLMTDITGDEDHFGDMDFKLAGTQVGMTALQVDVKNTGLTESMIRQAMEKAKAARMKILRYMVETLPEPREAISGLAPRLLQVKIHPDEIGKLIGPGGKMIRKIEEETGAKVEVEDSGVVTVSSPDAAKAEAARDFISKMFERPEVGKIYEGPVTGIKDFGAFVEILPGTDGLCHVSELADKFVDSVENEVKMGDVLRVKVIALDNQGRIKLSRKAVLKEEQS